MTAAEPIIAQAALEIIAGRLIGQPVLPLRLLASKGNNRVFRVETANGDNYILKSYAPPGHDCRDRIGTEYRALVFMRSFGIEIVPRPVGVDFEARVAVYDWQEGEPANDNPCDDDIGQAADFLATLKNLGDQQEAGSVPLASEACLSAWEIERQILVRFEKLSALKQEPELASYLANEFAPALSERLRAAKNACLETGQNWQDDLPRKHRTLNPSDFGLHNAIRTPGGLFFIDFEYFGWDDPIKMLCDFFLHPGMNLSVERKRMFLQKMSPCFHGDPNFEIRLALLYPLYALRWSMILLNEFFPHKWACRELAGQTNWPAVKARQLAKARAMLKNESLAI